MNCQRGWAVLILVMIFTIFIEGCAPAPPVMSGRDITEEQLKVLSSSSISKDELLDLLGPPYAIFKIGEKAKVQRGANWNTSGNITLSYSEEVDSEVAFSLFDKSYSQSPDNRVYYYYFSKSSKVGYVMLVYVHEKIKNRAEKLYVLVNERDEMVRDFVYSGKEGPENLSKNLF